MSDVQRRALFFQHKGAYVRALEAKKAADATFKNVCKLAKAEVGEHAVIQIKTAIDVTDPVKADKLKAEMEAQYEAARWAGMPLGAQGNLFDPDRRPATEIAHSEGFEAGAGGVSMRVPEKYGPSSDAGQAWCKGWNAGQESIFQIAELKGSPLLKGTQPPGPPEPSDDEAEEDGDGEAEGEGDDDGADA